MSLQTGRQQVLQYRPSSLASFRPNQWPCRVPAGGSHKNPLSKPFLKPFLNHPFQFLYRLDGNKLCSTVPGAQCLFSTGPAAVPSSGSNKRVVIILILVGSLGAAAAAVCTCLFFVLRRRKSRVGSLEEDEEKWMRFDILGKGYQNISKIIQICRKCRRS